MGKLKEHSRTKAWLSQFSAWDRPAANVLLDSLQLISFGEFEGKIVEMVERIASTSSGRIGVFAVDPSFELRRKHERIIRRQLNGMRRVFNPVELSENKRYHDLQKSLLERKERSSSAGRINHAMTMLERRIPRRIKLNPSEKCMRAEKFKHIILIDDIIGSGQSIVNFWNAWATKSLKSWLSYKYCNLWIIAYAAHQKGVEYVRDRITYLDESRVILDRMISHNGFINDHVRDICKRYSAKTSKPVASLGYGGQMSPFVFQHGCPNNCSAILWDDTSQNWSALFPNRSVPRDMYSLFERDSNIEIRAQALWDSGQEQLAVALLDAIMEGAENTDVTDLLTVVGLLAKGVKRERIPSIMIASSVRIASLLKQSEKLGFTSSDGKVSPTGRDLLARSRRGFRQPFENKKNIEITCWFYYPTQFEGVQRKSSWKTC